MNWEAVSAIGEIVGAIAVVATLVYLAIQIRQSRQTDRTSAYDSSIRNLIDIRQTALENPEITDVPFRGLNAPETLNDQEQFRFRLLMNNIMLSFWHVRSQPAELSSEMWKTQIPAIKRVIGSPGGKWFWENHRSEFVASFRAEIDQSIASTQIEPFKVEWTSVNSQYAWCFVRRSIFL